ncbi:MAG: hypothetical protein ACJ8R9_21500 [Steroidobacteraceae bacterium]
MSNEPAQPDYRQTLHDAVLETAHGLVTGSLGVVEATRRFMELAAELDALDDEDFIYFIELDSRSDTFPLGIAREQWNSTALEREDLDRGKYEDGVRADAVAHCRNLIARYASPA